MKKILLKYWPVLVAIVLFVTAAYVYCSPVLDGKEIMAGDIQNYVSASQEGRDYHEQTGDFTWWTGSMFSGMPNYQVGGGHYKSDSVLSPVHKFIGGYGDKTAWKLILYFLCFFIMFRCFGVGMWTSIVGALATGLSSYFLVIIGAGHNTKTITIALTAVVLGGFNLIFTRRRYALGAILVMFFTAGGFARHPQMFYYYCMFIGLLWIAQAFIHIKEKRVKDLALATVIFGLSLGVGVGTSSSNVFANAEYTAETMRGGSSNLAEAGSSAPKSKGLDIEYATQWSYGIDESMSFLIPGVKGGASGYNVGKDSQLYKTLVKKGVPARSARDFCSNAPMYWGEQPFTSGNVYMGAVVCFLFVLGLILVRGPFKWAVLVATLFSVFLSWGHNWLGLTEFFFKWFPMYSKFRAVSSILIVAEVAMPLLGFIALRDIFSGKVEKQRLLKALYVSSGVCGGICLLYAVLGPSLCSFTSSYDSSWASSMPGWLYDAIREERAALLASDSWRSLLFIALSAAALWLYARGVLKKVAPVVAVIGVLAVADLWGVDKRYFNDSYFVTPKHRTERFEKQPWEETILRDQDPDFRVMNLTTSTFNDARTSHYLKSIGGYSAAKLRRYQELIDEHISKFDMPVLNMLNTKYFIVKGEDGAPAVQYNPDAFGNLWFAESIKFVKNSREESAALSTENLRTTAVIDEQFKSMTEGAVAPGECSAVLLSYSPKALSYKVSCENAAVLVFSEIYYPHGWKATVDGKPQEHFRADYTLRAMKVDAGEHQIDFIFDPDSVRKGETLSLICIFVMYGFTIAAAVLAIIRFIRKRRENA